MTGGDDQTDRFIDEGIREHGEELRAAGRR
jgi:hypothetical protein